MTDKQISQFAKLMADDKVNTILNVTGDKQGLTPKEISKATKIPTNQLYYTLNKMVDADLLEIVKQERVKNLVEHYYSSYNFRNLDTKISQEVSEDVEGLGNISTNWLKEHYEDVIQWLLYRDRQYTEALQASLSKEEKPSEIQHPSFLNSDLELSEEAEVKLWKDIIKLVSEAEKNDQGDNKRKVDLLIKRW